MVCFFHRWLLLCQKICQIHFLLTGTHFSHLCYHRVVLELTLPFPLATVAVLVPHPRATEAKMVLLAE